MGELDKRNRLLKKNIYKKIKGEEEIEMRSAKKKFITLSKFFATKGFLSTESRNGKAVSELTRPPINYNNILP